MAIPQVLTALAIGLIGYQVVGKKKRKKSTTTTTGGTGTTTPTEPTEPTEPGEPEPSGPRRPFPRPRPSPPAVEPTGNGDLPTIEPDEPGPDEPGPTEPKPTDDWPDYPPPGPVDLSKWTDPKNYPTPGMFHQIGGENSATTLQAIARMALTTAFYLTFGDLAVARELAQDADNWRAYREAIECSPWNHALYGSASQPGTSGYYETPHGDQISMFPVHANVEELLAIGEPPKRRVRTDDPRLPAGGRHAFIWLPSLDEDVLANGRVKVKHEHWPTGDFMIMPPPEVLALGVVGVPPRRQWGCGEYETTLDFDEE